MSVPTSASSMGLKPGIWTVDPVHSTVEFLVKHLVVSKVRGRFTDFSGSIEVGEDILDSKVIANIAANSIFTGQEMRDNHLRTGDFLDIEKYPTITFTSTAVTPTSDSYKLTGDLTMHGVSKAVELDLEFNGVSKSPQGDVRAGFSAKGVISRKDFQMEFNAPLDGGGMMLSDKLNIEIEIEAVEPAE